MITTSKKAAIANAINCFFQPFLKLPRSLDGYKIEKKEGGGPPTPRADFDYFFCCKVWTTRADLD